MTNAVILCDLLWKVQKSHAANREGSFKCGQIWPLLWLAQPAAFDSTDPATEFVIIIYPVYQYLFHTMTCFYVIYRYVFSEWRSIRPVENNQYNITMATHYDMTMGNDVAKDAHREITMGNYVAIDIHCDITMSNDVAMCTYHGITMLWTFSIMYSLLYA